MNKYFDIQLFAAETGTIVTTDMEPGISIDFSTRLHSNIAELQKLLGISELDSVSAGTTIEIYKTKVTNDPEQVAEGETIGLTHVERKLAKTIVLKLDKHRWNTTAENIQKMGREKAINDTDDVVLAKIRKSIKGKFFANIAAGTGEAQGVGLQGTLAKSWAAVTKYFEDMDVTPIYFVSVDDVADYLSTSSVGLSQAFGLSYLENFLGMGDAIVSPGLPAGKVIATAKENLRGVHINAASGDVARTFGLTADSTGLVGMKHYLKDDNASVGSLAMCGIEFYPEVTDGVIVGTINPAAGA